MYIIDIKKNFMRAYIRYLIEEVNVIPRKDYTLDILGSKIVLMVGEEKKIPRFIAQILEKEGIVKVVGSPQRGEIISNLIILTQRSAQPQIQEVDRGFYMRLAEVLSTLTHEQIKDLKAYLEKLVSMRIIKMLHRIHTRKLDGLDLYEQTFLKTLFKLTEDFHRVLTEESIKLVKNFAKETTNEQ